MIDLLGWYMVLFVIGLVNLPITFVLFAKLPSRGFALAKPIGLLLWAFPFWVLVSLGVLSNDLNSQIAVLIFLLLVNGAIYGKHAGEIGVWFGENRKWIARTETIFLITFLLWSLVRALNPDILYTEKFMEIAFINGILRSPSFPPIDPWLSGYGISYYYFGYVMVAMLTRISGVVSTVAYNLTSSSWYALTAIAIYGLLVDCLSRWKSQSQDKPQIKRWMLNASLIAPLMLLIVSNWHGVFDIAHERGLFSASANVEASQANFWSDLDLRDLEEPPTTSDWVPERTWQWWAASRTVKDFRLQGEGMEVIDEFPFFTYLLSDIHPHLLGMPFVIIAIAQAFNALSGGWEGDSKLVGVRLPIKGELLVFVPILLGGIAFLNTWDFPFYLLLVCVAFVYWRFTKLGMSGRIWELMFLGAGFGVSSILFYFPFYMGFSSQAGGILPSLVFFTRGKYFWIMFGPLLISMITFLLFKVMKDRKHVNLKLAGLWTLVVNSLLLLGSWGLGWLINARLNQPQLVEQLYGQTSGTSIFLEAILIRLKDPFTWITIAALTFLALCLVLKHRNTDQETPNPETHTNSSIVFIAFLVLLGCLLTVFPEFIFLRDQFVSRMNTIFKFYFQAWIVWSIAASFGLIYLLNPESDRSFTNQVAPWLISFIGFLGLILAKASPVGNSSSVGWLLPGDVVIVAILILFLVWLLLNVVHKRWRFSLAILSLIAVAGGLVYPSLALPAKVGDIEADRITLDGFTSLTVGNADQTAAIEWLQQAPTGAMAEAVADTGGSYTTYNIVSTFSGMPAVLGWVGHEAQWRGGYEEIGNRQADIRTLYSTNDWQNALDVINQYNIRYIYVGDVEYRTYSVMEAKFEQYLDLVFASDTVRIYEVASYR